MRTFVTIGTFDGVHKGHQKVLRHLLRLGRKTGLKTRVLMFAKPPRLYFHPGVVPRLLTTPDERVELIKSYGVSDVKVLHFDQKVASQSPERFFAETIVSEMEAAGVLVGHDFCFGKDRSGTVETLAQLCRERGMIFEDEPLVVRGPAKVSSTRVRVLLDTGRVERASQLLGRPYTITGTVVKGQGLGSKLGFATANLQVDPQKLLPPGVFAAKAKWGRRSKPAAVNIGTRPTVDGTRTVVEAHLIGFSGALVGKTLTLELVSKLRAEQKFPSVEELQAQLQKDVREAKRILGAR